MFKVSTRVSIAIIFLLSVLCGEVYSQAQDAEQSEGTRSVHNVRIDGSIAEGEYDDSAEFGDGIFTLYWAVAGEMVSFGMSAETTGWVSVGFDPDVRMQNADMVVGWVDDEGEEHVVDSWSSGPTGPHSADVEQDGTDDIISFSGSESDGTTVIEFHRLLDTGDSLDKSLAKEQEFTIIWGIGEDDQYDSYHPERGTGTILLHEEVVEGEEEERGLSIQTAALGLWVTHASLMSLGLLAMIAGFVICRYYRKSKWWMKYHRGVGLTSAILLIGGLLVGVYLVIDLGIPHFSNTHTIAGLVTIIAGLITPALGYAMPSKMFRKYAKQLRPTHKWIGRLKILLMIWVAYLGFAVVGLV